MAKRQTGPIYYYVEFVPREGYAWKIVENGVTLWEGMADTERSARWDMEDKAQDFGLQVPEDY
jgi:hypothetical protein